MFNRGLALAAAAIGSLGSAFSQGAGAAINFGDGINPGRVYGPRVVTHKNIGRSYGCTLRHMTKAEIAALPPMEHGKGPRDAPVSYLTHVHKRRYMPHVGAKEAAKYARR